MSGQLTFDIDDWIGIDIFDIMKDNPLFIAFYQKIEEIEKTMNNRTANKLGIYCRWFSFSSKNKCINCSYGEGRCSLMKCVSDYIDIFSDSYGYADDNLGSINYPLEMYQKFKDKVNKDAFDLKALDIWKKKIIKVCEGHIIQFFGEMKWVLPALQQTKK